MERLGLPGKSSGETASSPEPNKERWIEGLLLRLPGEIAELEQHAADPGTKIAQKLRLLVFAFNQISEDLARRAYAFIESKMELLEPGPRECIFEEYRKLPHSSSKVIMAARERGFEEFLTTFSKNSGQPYSLGITMRNNILSSIERMGKAEDEDDFSDFSSGDLRIVKEAQSRGIQAKAMDNGSTFELSHEGRTVLCQGTLPELVDIRSSMLCDDKVLTSRYLAKQGIRVPDQQVAGDSKADAAFLENHKTIVVKPGRGGKGDNISMNVNSKPDLEKAIKRAAEDGSHVVLEEVCPGRALRILVIEYKVVVATEIRPPVLIGNGVSTVRELIENHKSVDKIPTDDETIRCLKMAGLSREGLRDDQSLFDVVPYKGQEIRVRQNSNTSTGGSSHDITDKLSPVLREAAEKIARLIK